MDTQEITISQQIEAFVTAIAERAIDLEADAEGQWFLIRQAELAQSFNKPRTDIMVKFVGNSPDPSILVPADITIEQNANTCPHFLQQPTFVKGWRCICPHVFQDVANDMFEFVLCLLAMLANPRFCGANGCEGKPDSNQDFPDNPILPAGEEQVE